MRKSDIGMIGLAVMGENLVMNMADKGFTVSVYNRTTEKVRHFVEGRARGLRVVGTYSLQELVDGSVKHYAQNCFGSGRNSLQGTVCRSLVFFQRAGRKGSGAAVRRLSCP